MICERKNRMDVNTIIQDILDAYEKAEKDKAELFAQCFDGIDSKVAKSIRKKGMPTLLCFSPTMKDHMYHFRNWVTVKENAALTEGQIILLWEPEERNIML